MIARYPKLSFLLIGFVMGLLIGLGQAYYGQQTIEEYKFIATEERIRYERVIETKSTHIAQLGQEILELQSSVHRTTTTKKDGSSVEVFSKTVNKKVDSKVVTKTEKLSERGSLILEKTRLKKVEKSSKKTSRLSVYLGYRGGSDIETHSQVDKNRLIIGGVAPLFGSFIAVGQAAVKPKKHWMVGVGISF